MTKETKPKMGITRRSFQIWGAKGGKIGGKKNAEKKGYFKRIGSLGGKAKRDKTFKSIKRFKELPENKEDINNL